MEEVDMGMRVHIVVIGHVQGVGFRYYTFKKAREIGIAGFVKNLPDGTVEIEAEGERSLLEELIEAVKVGPRTAVVNDLHINWEEPTGEYQNFSVEY